MLTESDLTGTRGTGAKDPSKRMPSRRKNAVDPLALRAGDPVVHEQHGVGRYVEMVQRTVQGATREYMVLEYAPSKKGHPGDRLYVPTDQLELVTRYVGGEAPTLDKMGGGDWAKRKGRAKKAVREIAAGLIQLYAARTSAPGHAFGPDTPWQRELEDAFPYVETPDQLEAINEVKADMEKPQPMDRVIMGDVGYGKTEIAVRAAFKAVQDGKQVAVLVPTTLLVQQHYDTFRDRFAQFPVTVRATSRFNTAKEQARGHAGIKEGTIDVVIGTHRLLGKEVAFKDLGLVIVDEEQRFGVEHKEHLKQMRTAVDVLTMSATPIPRTLEMSLTGIREMSTILTPPEERHPVLTFVGPYDEKQVAAAIRRELMREGQVFYLHNRVESIDRTAKRLAELVPEARIATGHGQMTEEALEQVMVGFWEKDYDVLVSTTIVESGLDIPNANTLIVERADSFGLSQLHQIRGRVGRGRERAYAYFTYPPERPLTELAHDRLATIAQNTEIGAGHGGRDEGPRDPRRRQPARRRAGRPHRERRLRPLHAARRRGRRRLQAERRHARGGRRGGPRVQGRPAGRRPPAARVRPRRAAAAGGLPAARGRAGRRRGRGRARRAGRPLRPAPDAGREPARRRPLPRGREGARAHRGGAAGQPGRPLRARCSCARARTCGSSGSTRARSSSRRSAPCWCPTPKTARIGGQPLRDTALLQWCADLLEAVLGDSVAAAAGVAHRALTPLATLTRT